MKNVPAEALNVQLAFATHDHNKVRAGKVHRVRSGRPLTATRNRQPRTWAACGAPITLAWPVLDFHLEVWGSSDVCLKCWPRWEQLTRGEKQDVDLAYGGDLRQTGHVRNIPWRRPNLSAVQLEAAARSICTHTYPDGTQCRMVDHSDSAGLAELHGVDLEAEAAAQVPELVPLDLQDDSPQGVLRLVLLTALIDEYGFDESHWTELGSLERIARAIEGISVRAEIHEELNQLTTCRVWLRGRMVFDGIDRSSLVSYRGEPVRDEWGVWFPASDPDKQHVDVQVNEADARRFSFTLNAARPELPTEVVRKVVTEWEVVPDGGH